MKESEVKAVDKWLSPVEGEQEAAAERREALRIKWEELKALNHSANLETFVSSIRVPFEEIGVDSYTSLKWKAQVWNASDAPLKIAEAYAAIESIKRSKELKNTMEALELARIETEQKAEEAAAKRRIDDLGKDNNRRNVDIGLALVGLSLGLISIKSCSLDTDSLDISKKSLELAQRQYALDSVPADASLLREMKTSNELARQQLTLLKDIKTRLKVH